jgi:hypothetical protein
LSAIAALGVAAFSGCGDDTFEPSLRYRMIGLPAASAGACPATVDDAPPQLVGATRVRLTYVDAGSNDLRCDVVLPLAGPASVIAVPDASRPADLIVEYVDDAGVVLGRGRADGIDLGGTGDVDVRVVAANAWSCAPERGFAARAFHSATPLPNGDLLLLGGIAGADGIDTIDLAAGFFLQTRAELFTPSTGGSRQVSIAGLVPRAFHQAYVVQTDAAGFTIAVVGGLTITGDPALTPVATVGVDTRLTASAMAVGAGGELLRYDTASSTFSRSAIDPDVERRGFGGLPASGSEAIAYVGGLDLAAAPPTVQADADRVDPATGLRTTTIGTRRQRLGASVTALSADQLLVWGGDPTAGDGTGTAELGELLTSWTTAPSTQALTIDATGQGGPHRAFHAAALAGDGSVIVAGGFRMEVGVATTPVTQVVQRLSTPTAMLLVTTLADETMATPAGYGAALRLLDGDVLIAGGNPDPLAAGCAPENMGLACATGLALRFDTATTTIAATGSLGVPRYGHQLSLLADGTVAATGGLAVTTGGSLHAAVDIELYEPRGAADDPLLPEIVRAPGDVARTGVGEPLAPCSVVVEYPDAAP